MAGSATMTCMMFYYKPSYYSHLIHILSGLCSNGNDIAAAIHLIQSRFKVQYLSFNTYFLLRGSSLPTVNGEFCLSFVDIGQTCFGTSFFVPFILLKDPLPLWPTHFLRQVRLLHLLFSIVMARYWMTSVVTMRCSFT